MYIVHCDYLATGLSTATPLTSLLLLWCQNYIPLYLSYSHNSFPQYSCPQCGCPQYGFPRFSCHSDAQVQLPPVQLLPVQLLPVLLPPVQLPPVQLLIQPRPTVCSSDGSGGGVGAALPKSYLLATQYANTIAL